MKFYFLKIEGEHLLNANWPVHTVINCRNPTLAKCGGEANTSKVGDLESSETFECLGFDNKA